MEPIFHTSWLLFLLFFIVIIYGNSEPTDWLKAGKCKGIWRPEKLPGMCTGMSLHDTFEEIKHIAEVNNSSACRALCCNIGDKCITWQYEVYSKECRFGAAMRLGNEAAGVPGWCEPFAPVKWNGRRVSSRNADGTVTFSDVELNTQCFGLGDERKAPGGGHMTTEQCKDACAADKECGIWQEFPGRGCFYHIQSNHCDRKKISKYEGGRKCIPNYCGGMEADILGKK